MSAVLESGDADGHGTGERSEAASGVRAETMAAGRNVERVTRNVSVTALPKTKAQGNAHHGSRTGAALATHTSSQVTQAHDDTGCGLKCAQPLKEHIELLTLEPPTPKTSLAFQPTDRKIIDPPQPRDCVAKIPTHPDSSKNATFQFRSNAQLPK